MNNCIVAILNQKVKIYIRFKMAMCVHSFAHELEKRDSSCNIACNNDYRIARSFIFC